jgi:hypothetical protein
MESSEEGVVFLFLEMGERHQDGLERAPNSYANSFAMSTTDFIPEKVRGLVWRRYHGKCAKCRGREELEFELIRPIRRNTTVSPDDVQLVCGDCLRRKNVLH